MPHKARSRKAVLIQNKRGLRHGQQRMNLLILLIPLHAWSGNLESRSHHLWGKLFFWTLQDKGGKLEGRYSQVSAPFFHPCLLSSFPPSSLFSPFLYNRIVIIIIINHKSTKLHVIVWCIKYKSSISTVSFSLLPFFFFMFSFFMLV